MFLIHAMYLDGHIMPHGVVNYSWKQDEAGYASLPEGPGLGVEVVESKFDEAKLPNKQFKWPTPKAPDGSVIDY